MKKFLYILIILISGTGEKVQAFDSTYSAILQSKIQSYLTSYSLKGISAAAIVPGQGIWLGAAGMSTETDPVSTDLIFGAGSITKNFMAAMILQLVEADSLQLDDTIGKWIPQYPNVNNSVTVRQLLDHSSGIYNMTDNPAFIAAVNSDLNRTWQAEEVLTGGYVLAPYFTPGSSWKYSNTNYLIIGMIVNRIMGTNISSQLHERFFTPFNMHESFLETQDTITHTYGHNWVDLNGDGILDDAFFIPTTSIYSATIGAGGISTRPENLVRWVKKLFGGEILQQSTMNSMLTFRNVTISGANGYGLGTMRYSIMGRNCYGHGGNIFGYTSVMMYSPADSIGIAVMMNKDLNGGPVGAAFMTAVIQNNPVRIQTISTEIPSGFSLKQNFPNPFNPETNISFELVSKERVKLSVYDLLGKEISVLFTGVLDPGSYSYKWNPENLSGGIYYYKLETETESQIKKMILLK